jgi:hypothetical protein
MKNTHVNKAFEAVRLLGASTKTSQRMMRENALLWRGCLRSSLYERTPRRRQKKDARRLVKRPDRKGDDLTGKNQREGKRAIFHHQHDCIMVIRPHHLFVLHILCRAELRCLSYCKQFARQHNQERLSRDLLPQPSTKARARASLIAAAQRAKREKLHRRSGEASAQAAA